MYCVRRSHSFDFKHLWFQYIIFLNNCKKSILITLRYFAFICNNFKISFFPFHNFRFFSFVIDNFNIFVPRSRRICSRLQNRISFRLHAMKLLSLPDGFKRFIPWSEKLFSNFIIRLIFKINGYGKQIGVLFCPLIQFFGSCYQCASWCQTC